MTTPQDADQIVVEPGRRSGRVAVRGTRIAVADILSRLAAFMTNDDLLADLPELERDDIKAACAAEIDDVHRTDAACLVIRSD